MQPGPQNLITDVPGIFVGNAGDDRLKSGVTLVLSEEPAVASGHLMGGAPGARETELLAPEQTVEQVDAVFLSGGSAFGLDAGAGIMDALAAAGRGFAVGDVRVPIVPGAILFDLANGGDKGWSVNSYRELGRAAFSAVGRSFDLGTTGAGIGATTASLKGGLGSASARLASGATVAALVAVNAVGDAVIDGGPHFWAAPFEWDGEFGGLGLPSPLPASRITLPYKGQARPGENTTIAVIATDARLTKPQAKRLAIMAHDGFARALWPSHTPIDGDFIFALSTGRSPAPDGIPGMIELGATASACMARAIARGVYEATAAEGDRLPTWRSRFGR